MLEYNKTTFNQVKKYVTEGKNCCVVNPCGSGKTTIMEEFIKEFNNEKILIITKQKNAKDYYQKNKIFRGKNVNIITYNRMFLDYSKNQLSDIYDSKYYLIDEAHYMGAKKWSSGFKFLSHKYHPLLIGITATPQRYEDQGTDKSIINQYFDNNSAGNFTVKYLQKKGYFIEPEYILSLYSLDKKIEDSIEKILYSDDLDDNKKNSYIKRIKSIQDDWEKTAKPEIVMRDKLPCYLYKEKSNRILIYTSDINDLETKRKDIMEILHNIFPDKKIKDYVYTHKTSEKPLKDFLKNDNNYIKVLFSINKIMETIHIDDLNIIIMLRPSISNRIITQQFGRINSINNDKKSLIIDMVGNLDNLRLENYPIEWSKEKSNLKLNKPLDKYFKKINSYMSIFNEIDRVTSGNIDYSYSYMGNTYKGSLSFLAFIFRKDLNILKKYISEGYSFEDAMEKVPSKKYVIKDSTLTNDYLYLTENITFSDNQKKLAEEYEPFLTNYFSRKNITDEDMQQNLRLVAYRRIYNSNYNKKNYILSQLISRDLNNYYKIIYRDKIIRYSLQEESIDDEKIDENNLYEWTDLYCSNLKNVLLELLETVTEREKYTIINHFGIGMNEKNLDEIGHYLNVTRERVRQIETKALRKLRHPCRARKLYGFRDCYNLFDLNSSFGYIKIHQMYNISAEDITIAEEAERRRRTPNIVNCDMLKASLAKEEFINKINKGIQMLESTISLMDDEDEIIEDPISVEVDYDTDDPIEEPVVIKKKAKREFSIKDEDRELFDDFNILIFEDLYYHVMNNLNLLQGLDQIYIHKFATIFFILFIENVADGKYQIQTFVNDIKLYNKGYDISDKNFHKSQLKRSLYSFIQHLSCDNIYNINLHNLLNSLPHIYIDCHGVERKKIEDKKLNIKFINKRYLYEFATMTKDQLINFHVNSDNVDLLKQIMDYLDIKNNI